MRRHHKEATLKPVQVNGPKNAVYHCLYTINCVSPLRSSTLYCFVINVSTCKVWPTSGGTPLPWRQLAAGVCTRDAQRGDPRPRLCALWCVE